MALKRLSTAIFLIMIVLFMFLSVSAWITAWQHGSIMSEMMGGVAPMWWIGPSIITTILATIVVVFYVIAQNISPQGRGEQKMEIKGLTEEEIRVVRFIEKNGGKALQKDISKSLNISRLKTHRLVSSLKRRGIVEVEEWGNTNLVKLISNKTQEH